MKLYEVEVTATVIVVGIDEDEAVVNAREDIWEIKNDSDFFIEVTKEADINSLPDDWDVNCIPYGGDGIIRIKNIKM